MTWKEVKDFVESKGVKDDDRVDYIEINWMTEGIAAIKVEEGWRIS